MRRELAIFACAALTLSSCAGEKAEGRPWVRQLQFTGVRNVKPSELKKKLRVEETHWYTRKKYLDPFTVDFDRERVEAYYRAHGYFNARVTSAAVIPKSGTAEKPISVDVKIAVEEGPATHIDDVQVVGLDGDEGAKLMRDLEKRLHKGSVFDHEAWLAEKARLQEQLQELGYAWAEVEGAVEVNRDTRLARLRLTATAGPRASYGDIRVDGTKRINPRLVQLQVNLRRGRRFKPSELEEARGEVYNLGVFTSVQVDYQHQPQHPEVADIVITVHETTFTELRVGVGLGLESQRTDVHTSLLYTRRNWRGDLRTLRLRIEPAYVAIPAFWNPERSGPGLIVEGQLIQPHLIWPRTQLKFTLGYDLGVEYAYQYHGPRTQLGMWRGFWRDRIRLGLSYNFQFLLFFNPDPAILADPAQTGQLFGYANPYRIGWWQEDFALDLRDKPLDAHKGFYFALTVEEGGVYAAGAFLYEKLVPEARGYIPMGSRVTLALRVQFGQIFTQGDLGSPVTRRFYLGGPSSHRGFNYNRLSRQVPSGLGGVPPIPIGGDQMLLAQAELRVNLFAIAKNWVALAAFFDAGDVSAPSCSTVECHTLYRNTNVQIADLHLAVGGGVRLKTLIGTLRFDVGVRLNRLSPTESDGTPNPDPGQRMAYHVSVGEAF